MLKTYQFDEVDKFTKQILKRKGSLSLNPYILTWRARILYYQEKQEEGDGFILKAAKINLELAKNETARDNFYKQMDLKEAATYAAKSGDNKVAIEKFYECIKIDKYNFTLNSKALLNVSMIYEKEKKTNDAIKALKESLYINPYYIKARVRRGDLYKAQGRLEKAMQDYREAWMLDPPQSFKVEEKIREVF